MHVYEMPPCLYFIHYDDDKDDDDDADANDDENNIKKQENNIKECGACEMMKKKYELKTILNCELFSFFFEIKICYLAVK